MPINKNRVTKRGVRVCFDVDENLFYLIDRDANGSMSMKLRNMFTYAVTIRQVLETELRGLLTPKEWIYLSVALKDHGILGRARFDKEVFARYLREHECFRLQRQGRPVAKVDVEDIIKKTEHLSGAHIDAIYCRVEDYWRSRLSVQIRKWAIF